MILRPTSCLFGCLLSGFLVAGVARAATQTKVFFVSDRAGAFNIWSSDASDGATATKVIDNASDPALSLDGTRLAFARNGDIFIAKVSIESGAVVLKGLDNGAAPTQLTSDGGGANLDASPSFSPAGGQLIFERGSLSDPDLFLINSDGSDNGTPRSAFARTGAANSPRFVSETQIAFAARGAAPLAPTFNSLVTFVLGSATNSFVVEEAGSTSANSISRLTVSPLATPIGRKVAFSRVGAPLRGLLQDNLNQTSASSFSLSAAGDNFPSFSPDGTKIIFSSTNTSAVRGNGVGGASEVFVLNADNSAVTRITTDAANDFAPVIGDITIAGAPANNSPVFVGAPYTFVFTQNRAVQGVKVAATDADGDALTYSLSGGTLPAGITFNPDGSFSGTPTALSGAANFTATVSDAKGGTATAQVTLSVTDNKGVIISEFRFRGAGGSSDEFVELYNTSGTPLNISGWSIKTSTATGIQTATVPANTMIPGRGHFLFTGTGYSLTNYGASDASLGADASDDSGVALLDAGDATQDAAGFATSAFKEGSAIGGYPTGNGEFAFVRAFNGTLPKDTDENGSDFLFVVANGTKGTPDTLIVPTISGTLSPQLGAPGPQGLNSPVNINSQVTTVLFDSGSGANISPNRVRVGSGNSGTLLIRRTLINKTGRDVTRIRFSVTRITSLGTPVTLANQADVRLITSPNETAVRRKNGTTEDVFGTTLEAGTGQPGQPLGGALGSSVVLNTPLPKDGMRTYSFLLQIKKSGNFSISLNNEGSPDVP